MFIQTHKYYNPQFSPSHPKPVDLFVMKISYYAFYTLISTQSPIGEDFCQLIYIQKKEKEIKRLDK